MNLILLSIAAVALSAVGGVVTWFLTADNSHPEHLPAHCKDFLE